MTPDERGTTSDDALCRARIDVLKPRLRRPPITRSSQKAQPCLLLMPNRNEFPDTEGRLVSRRARKNLKILHRVSILIMNGLPQLIGIAPRADDKEVEILFAAMQDHKAQAA
jgi:hypothetical protein